MTKTEAINAVCEAVGAPTTNVYDFTIRFNGEVRIGYKAGPFLPVEYRWFRGLVTE